MTQEEKELLMKDLCGRLPYRVKIKTNFFKPATLISLRKHISLYSSNDLSISYDISGKDEPFQMEERWGTPISEIKPYLFPLSSMTEEQWMDTPYANLNNFTFDSFKCGCSTLAFETYEVNLRYVVDFINWCYKNHFDVYGLIEKGLAIDCTDLNIY